MSDAVTIVDTLGDDEVRRYAKQLEQRLHEYEQANATFKHQGRDLEQMAEAVLSLADDGGMPDSFKQTDSRMIHARAVLEQLGSKP